MANPIYKQCEICGEEKRISDFSKTYENICNSCVTGHTGTISIKADEEYQKVVVKSTGETVFVKPCHEPLTARLAFYETKDGRKFPMFSLEFEKDIDWEQRRYEIAKDVFASMLCILSVKAIRNRFRGCRCAHSGIEGRR